MTVSTIDRARRREIIENFNRRVDQAALSAPPSKGWVRKALRRRGADRCPVRLRRLSLDIILQHGERLAELFEAFPEDTSFVAAYDLFLGYRAPDCSEPMDPIDAMLDEAQWTDEWGTRWGHAAGGMGASTLANPIQDWSQLDDYLANRMPDPGQPGRMDGALPALRKLGASRYFVGMTHMALFERFHCLRGMENTFEDFYVYPDETRRLLGTLADYYVEIVRQWGALKNVDGIFISDDWGTQQSLMISPEMWRAFFAEPYRRICSEAHRFDLDVVFHSCGHVTEIIGDLIDAGVDVLDPLQPETMDLKQVAKEYGGHVAFCGGISDQWLERYSPDQIREHVLRTKDMLGRAFQNAYIVAPSNVLPPGVPFENLEALFEASHQEG